MDDQTDNINNSIFFFDLSSIFFVGDAFGSFIEKPVEHKDSGNYFYYFCKVFEVQRPGGPEDDEGEVQQPRPRKHQGHLHIQVGNSISGTETEHPQNIWGYLQSAFRIF